MNGEVRATQATQATQEKKLQSLEESFSKELQHQSELIYSIDEKINLISDERDVSLEKDCEKEPRQTETFYQRMRNNLDSLREENSRLERIKNNLNKML